MIQGQVAPSVTKSVSTTTKLLKGLQTQAVATNRAIASIGKAVAGVAGLAGGLLAIGGLTAGMEQAVQLSKDNEQLQEQILIILKNQRAVRGQNVDLAQKDLKNITDQAVKLQGLTGIYKNVYERGAMIFAQTHRTTEQIHEMQNVMANLLVSQKMQGKSAEDLQEVYLAVGKAIQTGMARNLNAVGVFLSPMEKQLLMIHAKMHDFTANIKIVEAAINRTYAGAAKARMGTLLGQADLAVANMQLSMEKMGDALLPVQQRLTIIFARMVPLIEPLVTRIANIINRVLERHMKDLDNWVSFMQRSVIPMMVNWIDKGWKEMIKALKWIKSNWDWIKPALIGAGVAAGVLATALAAIVVAVGALNVLGNPFTWVIVAGAAIGELIAKWKQLLEWTIGTKLFNQTFDPKNKGWGYTKKFKPGEVPKAIPIEQGWLNVVNKAIDNWFNKTLPNYFTTFWSWLKGWITKAFDFLKVSFTEMGKTITDTFLLPFRQAADLWGFITGKKVDTGGNLGTAGRSNVVGPGSPNAGNLATAGRRSSSGSASTSSIYVPGQGIITPFQPDTSGSRRLNAIYNNPGAMGLTQSALKFGATPSGHFDTGHAFAKFPTREAGAAAQFSMWMNPKLYKGHTLAQAITNWIGPGEHGEAEFIAKKLGIPLNTVIDDSFLRGAMGIRLMQAQAQYEGQNVITPEQWKRAQDWAYKGIDPFKKSTPVVPMDKPDISNTPPVTINNHVQYHIHGSDEENHRKIAGLHQKHIDQMSKDLAEVTYRQNRSRFDGSNAV